MSLHVVQSFTHPCVIANLYDFPSSSKTEKFFKYGLTGLEEHEGEVYDDNLNLGVN